MIGFKSYRLKDPTNELERKFSEAWIEENKADGFINRLLSEKPNGFDYELSNIEEKAAATVIQWLGTDCGQGFIKRVMEQNNV